MNFFFTVFFYVFKKKKKKNTVKKKFKMKRALRNSFESNISKKRKEKSDDVVWLQNFKDMLTHILDMDTDHELKRDVLRCIARELGASLIDVTVVAMQFPDNNIRKFVLDIYFRRDDFTWDGVNGKSATIELSPPVCKDNSESLPIQKTLEGSTVDTTVQEIEKSPLYGEDTTLDGSGIPHKGEFSVIVKLLNGKEYTVPASSNMTVYEFKENVMYVEGITDSNFNLLFKGDRFDMDPESTKTLADYNVMNSRAKIKQLVGIE